MTAIKKLSNTTRFRVAGQNRIFHLGFEYVHSYRNYNVLKVLKLLSNEITDPH
jgi:hypothetical protein